MLRKVRLQYLGAMCHVMSGDQLEDIFLDDVDRYDFIKTLAIEARLRRETTLSVKRIAERLHLRKPEGARTNAFFGRVWFYP